MEAVEPCPVLESDATLFEDLFAGSSSDSAALLQVDDDKGVPYPVSDEVGQFLMMGGVVHS